MQVRIKRINEEIKVILENINVESKDIQHKDNYCSMSRLKHVNRKSIQSTNVPDIEWAILAGRKGKMFTRKNWLKMINVSWLKSSKKKILSVIQIEKN